MKPIINDKKCGASEKGCTAIKICPVDAIGFVEVEEALTGVTVECSCKCSCGCDCKPNPYGRIIIDYDKCIECGVCADECCGKAIELV